MNITIKFTVGILLNRKHANIIANDTFLQRMF